MKLSRPETTENFEMPLLIYSDTDGEMNIYFGVREVPMKMGGRDDGEKYIVRVAEKYSNVGLTLISSEAHMTVGCGVFETGSRE